MIKKISIYSGMIAFFTILIIGFLNQLNWFTIFIRAFLGFLIFYAGMTIIGMIGITSILHQQVKKRHVLQEEAIRAQEEESKQ